MQFNRLTMQCDIISTYIFCHRLTFITSRLFQEHNHLTPTGELDEATIKLMNTPRCGLTDNPAPSGMPLPFVLGKLV